MSALNPIVLPEQPRPPASSRWRELLLLTRPYSWTDAALNALVGLAVVAPDTGVAAQAVTAVSGVALWWTLNWVSERIQHDPGRPTPGTLLALAPFVIASSLLGANAGLPVMVPLAALLVAFFAYPIKATTALVGPLGPAIRGVQTALVVVTGAIASGAAPSALLWRIAGALAFVQASRTLVADVRDVETDQYELPRLIGPNRAMWVARGLFLVGVAWLVHVGVSVDAAVPPWTFVPLVALGGMLLLGRPKHAYEMHVAFVFGSTVFKAFFYGGATHAEGVAMLAVALQVPLLLTYWRVPRRSNRAFLDRLVRAVRLVGRDR